MIVPEIITEDFNYFGDSVFTFKGKSYNFYQYNCSEGRQLIKDIEACSVPVLLCIVNEFLSETRVKYDWALPKLREMLEISDRVSDYRSNIDTPEAEIAAHYGYY